MSKHREVGSVQPSSAVSAELRVLLFEDGDRPVALCATSGSLRMQQHLTPAESREVAAHLLSAADAAEEAEGGSQ